MPTKVVGVLLRRVHLRMEGFVFFCPYQHGYVHTLSNMDLQKFERANELFYHHLQHEMIFVSMICFVVSPWLTRLVDGLDSRAYWKQIPQ